MTLAMVMSDDEVRSRPAAATIRVVIADAHPLVGAGLSSLLGSQPDIDVVATVLTGAGVLDACRRALPAVVVVDARLPGVGTAGATAALHQALPATRLLVLTPSGHPAELQAAIRAGAHGYLPKDVTPIALFDAVRRIAAGHQVFDPTCLSQALARRPDVFAPTASELRTLTMVAGGLSNQEIARRLCLSPGTVRNYVSSLIAKTNARNRVDAIRIARDLAWI